MRVAIVDTHLCNVDSMARAVEECGGHAVLTSDAGEVERADRIILPGVGSFHDAMVNLQRFGLVDVLRRCALDRGIPLLGVCLGMQLLATEGTEGTPTAGLGFLDATVLRLEPEGEERVPHVGWNEVEPVRPSRLFDGVRGSSDFYFVHSYHVVCRASEDVLACTPFAGGFVSAVQRENVMGVQFHPEKSQRTGLTLLRNFLGR